MALKLYSYYRSSASYRVRIGLYLKGLEFEYHPIHLVKDGGEQFSNDYMKLNPLSQVPSLIDGDLVLTQSTAILNYLDSLQPDPLLFPSDAKVRAKTIQVAEIINSGIQPIQNLTVMNYVDEKHSIGKEGKFEWAHYWIERGFKALEQTLASTSGKFAVGDEVTLADLYLPPQTYNARRFKVDMEQFPNIVRVEKAYEGLEAFEKAKPENQPDAV